MKQYSSTMIFLLSVSAVPVSIYAVLVSVSAVSAAGILCRRHTGTQPWQTTITTKSGRHLLPPWRAIAAVDPKASVLSCRYHWAHADHKAGFLMLCWANKWEEQDKNNGLPPSWTSLSFQSAALLKMKNDLMNDEYKWVWGSQEGD